MRTALLLLALAGCDESRSKPSQWPEDSGVGQPHRNAPQPPYRGQQAPVPEPGTLVLLGGGILALVGARKRTQEMSWKRWTICLVLGHRDGLRYDAFGPMFVNDYGDILPESALVVCLRCGTELGAVRRR